jgi:hypothetical protein
MAKLMDVPEVEPQEAPQQEEQQDPIEALAQGEEPQEEELPDKYQGKSLKDLVQMHQEAEKALGRQGSEVGELRKLVDNHILSNTQPKEEEQSEEPIDFWTDPEKAIEQRLSNHPKIRELEAEKIRTSRETSQARLAQKHPDYQEILGDEAFAQWIQSSKIRTKLFIEADQQYDTDSADELFSLWKERKQLSEATVKSDSAARKEQVRKASTGNARGSNTPPPRKTYRRSDLITLMERDPELYASRADEFLRAYAEKRVI